MIAFLLTKHGIVNRTLHLVNAAITVQSAPSYANHKHKQLGPPLLLQVQPGGKSMLDHYPYSACTIKEVNVDQSGTAQLVGSGSRLG